MGRNIDLDTHFFVWLNEPEGFHIRAERLDELKDPEVAIKWLRAAYILGARTIANDTIDALGDYATAMAGVYSLSTPSAAYDIAAENLSKYYQQIFEGIDNEHL